MTDTGGTLGTLIIEPIPCLKDNYAYLIRDSK
jgi:hypothetical protein